MKVSSVRSAAEVPTYYLLVSIGGVVEDASYETFGEMLPDYDYVVIGRNVLDKLRFTFDGPAREFELIRP